MTLWWANHLKSKDDLKVGQKLVIPPVDGTVHVVKAGETLAEHRRRGERRPRPTSSSFNGLTDETVTVGQTLILPGGHGKPIPTPKPQPRPVAASGGGGGGSVPGSTTAAASSRGRSRAATSASTSTTAIRRSTSRRRTASRIVAAASGTVIFAGWKDNGGGYQVWIAHGSGLYTTYNHMSAITVGVGQSVGRAQQVGRVGQSGWATGPHCHFEVWRGHRLGQRRPTGSTRCRTCNPAPPAALIPDRVARRGPGAGVRRSRRCSSTR